MTMSGTRAVLPMIDSRLPLSLLGNERQLVQGGNRLMVTLTCPSRGCMTPGRAQHQALGTAAPGTAQP